MDEIELIVKERKAAVLTPSQLPCLSRVPTVNLTSGCAHACLYCYGRGYSQYPGEGKVILYGNTLQKLREEVRRKRVKPAFVYFSPSTDVFQPVNAVLSFALDVFSFLLSEGIGVAFVTKGAIPPEHMALFAAHPKQVRAQIGLITLDPKIIRTFEPRCAPIETRLQQIHALVEAGIETEVRLDPILPSLTDDAETLSSLFRTLKGLRINGVALNVLYLRPAILGVLRTGITDEDIRERLLRRYKTGTRIRVCGNRFSQTAISLEEREKIFRRAIDLAATFGLKCHCCGCMNPDLSNETCNLTGEWLSEKHDTQQMQLL